MKQLILSSLMVLVLALSVTITQAKPTQVTLANAFFAEQMPADTDIYMSIRTDEAYITQLDGIFQTVLSSVVANFVPEQAPTMQNVTLYTLLDTVVANAQLGMSFERDIRPWLGNSIALGGVVNDDTTTDIILIIDHADRQTAEDYITALSRGAIPPTTEGNFTVYTIPSSDGDLTLALNDDVAYLSNNRAFVPLNGNPSPNLRENEWFVNAVGTLPATSYNGLLVADTARLATLQASSNPLLATSLSQAYTAVGITILDGVSLTLDVAQIGLPEQLLSYVNQPVDSNFLQYIPANATGVIHGTNLNSVLEGIIEQAELMTGQNFGQQLEHVTVILGMDIFELLLSGDFGLYFTYKPDNFEAVVNAQMGENPAPAKITDLLELGVVFEIGNPDQARQFIRQLYALSNLLLGNAPHVSISQEDIGGYTALVLTVNDSNMFPIEVIISTNDVVFVVGTRESVTEILTGNGGFVNNASYQDSLGYALPNATHFWYVDRVSLSAIADTGTLWFTPISSFDPPQAVIDRLLQTHTSIGAVAQLFDHATVSTSVNGDVLNIRAVVTLSQ